MKHIKILLFFIIFYTQSSQSYEKDNVENLRAMQNEINAREKFFLESFAQKYDGSKIDSKNGLELIDFCAYPPDRSLVYGALQNGRFHGDKVNNLPFACSQNSGAKKIFIRQSNISNAYRILRSKYTFLYILKQNMPMKNLIEHQNDKNISYIWQVFDTKSNRYVIDAGENARANFKGSSQRLWIIYTSKTARFTLIFTTNGGSVEAIMQYVDV